MDARTVASTYAQGLRFLCETTQINVNTEIINSLGGFLVSLMALTNSTLKGLLDHSPLAGLLGDASERLVDAAAVFSYTLSADMAISALSTNAEIDVSSRMPLQPSLAVNGYRMSDGFPCYCLPTFTCVAPAAIYSTVASKTHEVFSIDSNGEFIKGMTTDCYPYNGLLASTLECYYDASCLQLLVSNVSTFPPLNLNLPSRFMPTNTVNYLVGEAMAEEYSYNYSAEAYYKQCAPRFCVYSYKHHSTLLTIITAIIGVISTLNTGLRLMVPFLVTHLMNCWRKCRLPSATKAIANPSETASGKNLSENVFSCSTTIFSMWESPVIIYECIRF